LICVSSSHARTPRRLDASKAGITSLFLSLKAGATNTGLFYCVVAILCLRHELICVSSSHARTPRRLDASKAGIASLFLSLKAGAASTGLIYLCPMRRVTLPLAGTVNANLIFIHPVVRKTIMHIHKTTNRQVQINQRSVICRMF
jgi:hypothetical protein